MELSEEIRKLRMKKVARHRRSAYLFDPTFSGTFHLAERRRSSTTWYDDRQYTSFLTTQNQHKPFVHMAKHAVVLVDQ